MILTACTEGPALRVDVRTDYVPQLEFQQVEISVGRGNRGASVETFTSPVGSTERFLPAHPALTTIVAEEGLYRVDVNLLKADGTRVAERAALVSVRGNTGVTVVLTRNCAEISCPANVGSDATECRDGLCVPPECTPETPDACPPSECSADSECPAELDCGEGRCLAGLCVQDLDPGSCAEGEVCAPDLEMCVARDAPPTMCTPSPEICDGVDNDCDPATPDGADEPCPAGQRCADGSCTPFTVRTMALGWEHTCAALDSGDVYCWGDDSFGQLGSGGNSSTTSPRRVEALVGEDVVALAAGRRHTCALTNEGALYCWGENSLFQLAITDSAEPVIRTPTRTPITNLLGREGALCAGQNFTCAIRSESNRVNCWGENTSNQLGDSSITPPMRSALDIGLGGAERLTCGDQHACALGVDTPGVYCWGDNREGALGSDTEPTEEIRQQLSAWDFYGVSSGSGFSCATKNSTENAYCWGANDQGQLGRAVTSPLEVNFIRVRGLGNVRTIASGYAHSCAINRNDEVFCWGANASGQLGVGSADAFSNQAIQLLESETISAVYAGALHTCAITSAATESGSRMFCWGANDQGQLGIGSTEIQRQPAEVVFP